MAGVCQFGFVNSVYHAHNRLVGHEPIERSRISLFSYARGVCSCDIAYAAGVLPMHKRPARIEGRKRKNYGNWNHCGIDALVEYSLDSEFAVEWVKRSAAPPTA
jgi:hypothetical protein